ncbi:hypothetical protein IW152_006141, partial [Coemansia sp. BCRC 34962]
LLSSTTKAANGGQLPASVEIPDSSDDDTISSDIELPADVLLPPEGHSAAKDDSSAHTTLGNETDKGIAFDPELSPDRAIQIIAGKILLL